MSVDNATAEKIKQYYGKVLKSSADLKTSACCVEGSPPAYIRELITAIHDEVRAKFYGCGSPIPEALEGCTVLDLGCGSGRDCYVLAQLVGASGRVIGVDMTDEQLAVARKHVGYHMDRFGFPQANVEFRQGYIENLADAGIEDSSVDVVVSNCVLNLSPAKEAVFAEILRVLKPGGELYFSDVFADRRIPKHLFEDPTLLGECLSGAFYTEDFRRMLTKLGCADFRVVTSRPLSISDPAIAAKIGMVGFSSATLRTFKLPFEDRCENYGQVATYRGTLTHAPHRFTLDDHHVFETGRPAAVCGNTAAMLRDTRFAPHFEVRGDTTHHFGLFDCAPSSAQGAAGNDGACC